MHILALETATDACSCALYDDGAVISRFEMAPRRHAERLLPMIDQLLADAQLSKTQLDGLSFGQGPGSFTGLRLAAAVVQGLALGLDRPVVPVSTLAALAQGQARQHNAKRVYAGLDARMQAVYWGAYQQDDKGLMQALIADVESKPDAVPWDRQQQGYYAVGSAWDVYSDILNPLCQPQHISYKTHPDAQDLLPFAAFALEHGQGVTVEQALPVYLRDNVAAKPKPKT